MRFKDRDIELFWNDPVNNLPGRVQANLRRCFTASCRFSMLPTSWMTCEYRLAIAIRKPQSAISDLVHGKRTITSEMAWLLGKALGTTAEFWLNLETTYQLKTIDESKMPDVPVLTI